MTIEKERELFDKWYGKKPMGWFEAVRYNTAWRAWQASANREGYKLVPVETLEESLSWASIAKWDSPSKESDLEIEKHEKIIETMIGACDDH